MGVPRGRAIAKGAVGYGVGIHGCCLVALHGMVWPNDCIRRTAGKDVQPCCSI